MYIHEHCILTSVVNTCKYESVGARVIWHHDFTVKGGTHSSYPKPPPDRVDPMALNKHRLMGINSCEMILIYFHNTMGILMTPIPPSKWGNSEIPQAMSRLAWWFSGSTPPWRNVQSSQTCVELFPNNIWNHQKANCGMMSNSSMVIITVYFFYLSISLYILHYLSIYIYILIHLCIFMWIKHLKKTEITSRTSLRPFGMISLITHHSSDLAVKSL